MIAKRKAYLLIIGFLYFFSDIAAFAQNQKLADSLYQVYKKNELNDSSKFELLRNLAFNEINDLKKGIKYADELISLSMRYGNNLYLHRGYFQKGNKYRQLGNLDQALDAFFKSLEAAKKANFIPGEGSAYGSIADTYAIARNHSNSVLYYNKAIATLRQSKDSVRLASAISNAGDEYLNHKDYVVALKYFKESKNIFEKINHQSGKAYSIGNIGMVYANIGDDKRAKDNINEAIGLLENLEDYYPICVYLISMSDIYSTQRDIPTALNYAQRSLELAQKFGLKKQISDANLKLSELYKESGNVEESFKYYKNYIAYRDSVNNINSVQKMADLRTDFEVSQKQIEVDLLNQEKINQRNILILVFIILVLAIIILGILYWFFINISREKRKSEDLLLNILPAETAQELKKVGKVEAVKFDQVTVLFTDFVEFTRLGEKVGPEQLVKSIDFYFSKFDEIASKHNLEKIKTIGDSYMCASGLPKTNQAHVKNAVNAAQEILAFVKDELNANDEISHFNIRIGLHTGPVVAGIVGIKKWQYDIWGDTVNIASRMESASEPGRINISETTYNEIKDEFTCQYRGEIDVKHRGLLKMYFLS